MNLHRNLLDAAVESVVDFTPHLKNSAICVTGASGFMAASLIAFLSRLNRVAGLNLRLYANARRPLVNVPLFDFIALQPDVIWTQAAVEDAILPDEEDLILVHTASYGSPRDYMREPMATYSANTKGLTCLLEQGNSLRQFVYFSSAEIYGQPPDSAIPTSESFTGALDPLGERSIYGESKRMGEVLGACIGKLAGIPFTALRPWNVYGPGQRLEDGRVPMDFIQQAFREGSIHLASNGTPTRSFCHIWDATRQIVSTLGGKDERIAFNIGNGSDEISMRDLAVRCAAACSLPAEAVSWNPQATVNALQRCLPDVNAVQSIVPAPQTFTSLDDGLSTLVDWCRFLSKP